MNGINLVSDTNPLIYLLNGNIKAAQYLDGKQVWISVITELELFGKKGLSKTEKSEIESLIDSCFVADMNSGIKELTKELLQLPGIRLPDAVIAATAIYLDLPLLTFDADFYNVPGLKLIILEP
jgi:predicted nucleic acid-binding protein